MSKKKIMIAGAGVNGVSLALSLKKSGVKACVYEQSPVPRVAGTGIYIWPQGMTILRRLLDEKKLLAIAKPISHLNTRDKLGNVIHSQALKQFVNGREETAYMFHRERLYKLLLEALDQDQVCFGKKLSGVNSTEGGVEMSFLDGSKVLGDCLVGADGIYSKTKQEVFPELEAVDSYVSVTRGIVNYALSGDQASSCDIYAGKQARIVTYPTSPDSNERYWFAAYYNKSEKFLDKESLLKRFKGYSPELLSLIEATEASNMIDSHLYDLPVDETWSRSNVMLLGDAAHAVLPTVAYGFSLGLENAYTLAQSMLNNLDDIEKSFTRYESLAIDRTRTISEVSRAFTHLFYKEQEGKLGNKVLEPLYEKFFSTIKKLPYESI